MHSESFLRFLKYFGWHKNRFLFLCALIGVFGGALAVAFQISIFWLFNLVWNFGAILGEQNRWWLMPLMPAFGAFLVGVSLSTFAKGNAEGSGIPQTKARFYNNWGVFRFKEIVCRFLMGTIFCGFGNSAGREGPTVHLCSAFASVLAQKLGFSKFGVKDAVPVGMASGISASFNAPLSSISFVFEELLNTGNAKIRHFGGMILAVVLAAAVSRLIVGEHPVIGVPDADFHTGIWMLFSVAVAVCAGFVGVLFLRLLLKLRGFANTQKKLPYWATATLGGLAVGIVATYAYHKTGYNAVFSVGYSALIPAFNGEILLSGMAVICLFKFLATILNYAMGGSGGLFSPTLVIGGMLGGVLGVLFTPLFGESANLVSAGILLGMGACFAAIIRCPITSVVIIFELTLNYSLILPLMVGNFIAYCIAMHFNRAGLYDALLLQDGIRLKLFPRK